MWDDIIILNDNKVDEYIERFFNNHRDDYGYELPPYWEMELKILKDCMSMDFKKEWLKAMFMHPYGDYPLDKMYCPKLDCYIGMYVEFANGTVCPSSDMVKNIIGNPIIITQRCDYISDLRRN